MILKPKRRSCDDCNQCCPHTELTFVVELPDEKTHDETIKRYGEFDYNVVAGAAKIRTQHGKLLRQIGTLEKPVVMFTVNKGLHKDCPYQNPGVAGCSIYQRRPDPCRTFECEWLLGNLQHQYHPNKVGAFVYSETYGSLTYPTLIIHEPQKSPNKLAESLLKKLFSESSLVVITRTMKDRRIYCTYEDWKIFRLEFQKTEDVSMRLLDACWRTIPEKYRQNRRGKETA